MQLRSQQGDTLDLILFRHYGYTSGITEQVLNLNPGLATLGPIIPTGTLINMPAAPTQAEQPLIQLWD
ncbi:tail protein X [Aeromonas salmonicida]|uniref:tail protein X n=1 Tax=Aeromonas salmonicida TaxID=645 RepID=UPI0023308356|nr:tail protein X [Aeromonas salmonicida]WCH24356.1 tail protein X [Aeromonas salmonicida]